VAFLCGEGGILCESGGACSGRSGDSDVGLDGRSALGDQRAEAKRMMEEREREKFHTEFFGQRDATVFRFERKSNSGSLIEYSFSR
jgi:hypothetical protein